MNVGGMNQGMGPLQDKFVQNVQQADGHPKNKRGSKDFSSRENLKHKIDTSLQLDVTGNSLDNIN